MTTTRRRGSALIRCVVMQLVERYRKIQWRIQDFPDKGVGSVNLRYGAVTYYLSTFLPKTA